MAFTKTGEEKVHVPHGYGTREVQRFVGLCGCGRKLVLRRPLDNLCDCGACYNMSGQEVVPSWQCDEKGEPYDDDRDYENECEYCGSDGSDLTYTADGNVLLCRRCRAQYDNGGEK